MAGADPDALLASAQRHFSGGAYDAAHADLEQLTGLIGRHPAVQHLHALVQRRRGREAEALGLFNHAIAGAPGDPHIRNNRANLLLAQGRFDEAIADYDAALALTPDFPDAAFNRALVLGKAGRRDAAEQAFAEAESLLGNQSRFWTARAANLRLLDRLDDAAQAYERALSLEPQRTKALAGRARVALERSEATAPVRFGVARAALPNDPDLLLGHALALQANKQAAQGEALLVARLKVDPAWIAGLEALAGMRWENGRSDNFVSAYGAAIARAPREPDIRLSLVRTLSGVDLHHAAFEAAAAAAAVMADDPSMALMAAIAADHAGLDDEASRRFSGPLPETTDRWRGEARFHLRQRRYDEADALLDRLRAADPNDISGWALTDLVWRMTGDPRHEWLHGQPGLVARRALEIEPAALDIIADVVREAHRTSAFPIGQSVRGGTQTRGALFHRVEPTFRQLTDAIAVQVDAHFGGLPPTQSDHPILRFRDRPWHFAGSWSVRLTDGGFHVSHIHPQGIFSSACYLALPPALGDGEGDLLLGTPPPDLGLDLPALHRVAPAAGMLALFPSTLYHETTAFPLGERMTAAFDIAAGRAG